MLKNLFKISLRNIFKEKGYSAINIVGLTIGLTCSIFLFLYVLNELSYDRYHKNSENIYRVISHIKETDNAFTWAIAQIPLADELQDNYPEVVNAVRFYGFGRRLFQHDEKSFYEEDLYLADSTVFDMFSYSFLSGDPNTALDEPNSIVLTKSLAIKYFGSVDVSGQTLTDMNSNETYVVRGVIDDVPLNSHFRFDGLISVSTFPQVRNQISWGNFGVYTYIQFPDGYDINNFTANLDKIIKDKVDPIFESLSIQINYELQKITDIHLHSKIQDEAEAGGDIAYVYIFLAVAGFMLVIACINYMNLATARSAKRAKEVGIRKVMGSLRKHLIFQFLIESIILTLFSFILSLLLFYALLPFFNELANKSLVFSDLFDWRMLSILFLALFIVGIAGGSYPAFYLSRFNPVTVLKGKLSSKGGNSFIRKSLVVLQFSISIFMLISTLVVYDQLNFLMKKDLGFDKNQVLRIEIPDNQMRNNYNVFRNSLLQKPMVNNVATANATPGSNISKVIFNVENSEGEMIERGIDFYFADYDFVEAMGMTILEGRNFKKDILSDTLHSVLVNEAMVARMNWDDPIGRRFDIPTQDSVVTKRVIGVIKDYHQNSLYDVIEPLIVMYAPNNYYTYVKLSGNDTREAVLQVENSWKEIYPNKPFEYEFLDQDFDAQYDADERRGQIFTVFSILTIVIACLGLLGLTSFTTEQRTKEIGIRKVIGATVTSIVVLISKEFIILVGIATLIAFPVSYYFMSNWLQAFAYKIDMNDEILTFIFSAFMALFITVATVGFHTARAAIANPVNSLKDE